MSKRMRFITGGFPDEAIRRARRRNRHHPHSLAVLIIDPQGKHLVCAEPASAAANGAMALVPPQCQYDHNESAVVVAHRMAQSLLTYRIRTESLQYLGHGFGNRHVTAECTQRHRKYVHWFGHVVSERQRLQQFYRLVQDSPVFAQVQWLRWQQLLDIHGGGTVSDEKLRLVMQALWVLTQSRAPLRESKAARIAGRSLAPELVPAVA